MTDIEKLIELLAHDDCPLFMVFGDNLGGIADYLIAHGVTFATDNPVGDKMTPVYDNLSATAAKWIPVTERRPQNFISVLGYMTDAGDFPPVRECYTVGNAFFFPALGDVHPVSHWMEIPEPPKGE